MRRTCRHAFTLVELLVVIAILSILISLIIPSIAGVRDAVRQSSCRSKLNGLGKALHAYSAAFTRGSREEWPNSGLYQSKIDTLGSLWLLVVHQNAMVDNFVCPADEASHRVTMYTGTVDVDRPFPEMDEKLTISYSYQVPHWVVGGPGRDHDRPDSFAVMADRSPFDPQPNPPTDGKLLTQVPGYGVKSTTDDYVTWINQLTEEQLVGVNSHNHGGKGQNVLYRDGHAVWQRSPLAGVKGDNIYTRQNGTSAANICVGVKPDETSAPYGNDDSYLRTFRAK